MRGILWLPSALARLAQATLPPMPRSSRPYILVSDAPAVTRPAITWTAPLAIELQ